MKALELSTITMAFVHNPYNPSLMSFFKIALKLAADIVGCASLSQTAFSHF